LNTLNPINFFMWMGVTTQIKARDFFSYNNMLLYFLATLFMIFLMLSLISYFAGKLRRWLTIKRMRYLNIGIGLIFIGLAIKLGVDAYIKHFVN
jgi:threonine/homoserine/homoserine lactone efflux protein